MKGLLLIVVFIKIVVKGVGLGKEAVEHWKLSLCTFL